MKGVKNMNEERLMKFKKYVEDLEQLYKANPELAKKEARESLQRAGILGKDGKLAPPYNGKKVNETDFTRGPGELEQEER